MAVFRVLLASLLISLLVLDFVHADMVRCSLSSRPNLCHRACGTCCARCNCVAPGTSGNYDKCPCYGSLTTHGGRRKEVKEFSFFTHGS
nr:similar to gibberellin-regulated proteins [Arabidopsis thaliana]